MNDMQQLEKDLRDKADAVLELQHELSSTNQGILLLAMEYEQAQEEIAHQHEAAVAQLQQKNLEYTKIIGQLREELHTTNHRVLLLTAEFERKKDAQHHFNNEVIEQLQKELDATNQGLIALTCELEQAKEKYRNIIEHANGAIFTVNDEQLIETANPASLKLFEYREEEMLGMHINRLLPNIALFFDTAVTWENKDGGIFFAARKKTGHSFPVEITFGESSYNDKTTWIIIVADITERLKTEQGLRLMARVFEDSYDAIMITDTDANIIDVNASFTAITGYSKEEVLGKNPRVMKSEHHDGDFYKAIWISIKESGRWSGEVWDKRKNGEVYPKWLSISAVKDGNNRVSNYVGIFTDITSRIEAEARLRHLAHYDQLTGLPNRTLFIEKLNWAIDLANRNRRDVALFFLDLDRFKMINDTLGHQAGDRLLCEIAERLQKCIRKSDTVARLAGDEFTIVLSDIKDLGGVVDIAEKVLGCFSYPVLLEGREIYMTTSIGITKYPTDGESIETLLKNADTAMYHAKTMGKNRYQFYSAFMNQKVHDELELETNLRKAIENNEFILFYQPQCEVKTGRITGIEALLRWRHPKLGFIPPVKFIPYAEKIDIIVHIGRWVMQHACEQYCRWQEEGLPPMKLSVNYSGSQLKQPDQVGIVSGILDATGMDPAYLNLELTESVIMENAENTIRALYDLKQMGLSLSVDDFGTGYSSLSYLKRFPIDTLKIDKSFVQDITTNADDESIATTIIAMAHALRLSVIAEGVETEEQLSLLKAKQCDEIQGYYFCRPVAGDELKHFVLMSLNSASNAC
jgi:diguanylate cyclase (GGDEF)-like protein/PAS domain S-box-containing protein